jgi:hypothetical protein
MVALVSVYSTSRRPCQTTKRRSTRAVRVQQFVYLRLLTFYTGGLSDHNDGKGFAFTVQFTPLPKPTDKKCRKNAASKLVAKIIFVHEDMSLHDALTKIIIQLKREYMFQDLHIQDGEIRQAPFDLNYTIARTTSKNIEIQNQTDYLQMTNDVAKKVNAAVTISMKEKKVPRHTCMSGSSCTDSGRLPMAMRARTLTMKRWTRMLPRRRNRRAHRMRRSTRQSSSKAFKPSTDVKTEAVPSNTVGLLARMPSTSI